MTRCAACDKNLNDFEVTRKSATTGEYIDLCNGCFYTVRDSIDVLERSDLNPSEVIDSELETFNEEEESDET